MAPNFDTNKYPHFDPSQQFGMHYPYIDGKDREKTIKIMKGYIDSNIPKSHQNQVTWIYTDLDGSFFGRRGSVGWRYDPKGTNA
jgi:hypothetical protein